MVSADSKAAKTRRPARTLDEQIADLKAKAAARETKTAAKTTAELDKVEEKISAAETKLTTLYVERRRVRSAMGLEDDGAGAQFLDIPAV